MVKYQLTYILSITFLVVINTLHYSSCVISDYELCDSNKLLSVNKLSYQYTEYTQNNCTCSTNCIRKCCAFGFYFSRGYCWAQNATYNPPLSFPVHKGSIFERNVTKQDELSLGFPVSCGLFALLPHKKPEDMFYLQSNGSLWVPEHKRVISSDEFCVDYTKLNNITAFICPTSHSMVMNSLITYGMIISLPFLVILFVVYAFFHEKTLHIKTLMCYLFYLFMSWVLTTYTHLNSNLGAIECLWIGYLLVYFFVSSFIWLNLMCFDMWRAVNSTLCPVVKANMEKKKFYFYTLYALGASILYFIILYSLNTYGNIHSQYHPGIGDGECGLRGSIGRLIYMYIPMTILIAANLVFFILTTIGIWRVRKNTNQDSYKQKKEMYMLFIKLFLAMGVNWSLDIISWFVLWKVKEVPSYIFYLTDFSNACYGLTLFLIFACRQSFWKPVMNRCQHIWRNFKKFNNTDAPVDLNTIEISFKK